MSENEAQQTEQELESEEPKKEEAPRAVGGASRARNKTVMLGPEVTGQLRAMLNAEAEISEPAMTTRPESAGGKRDPFSEILPPPAEGKDDGYVRATDFGTAPAEKPVEPPAAEDNAGAGQQRTTTGKQSVRTGSGRFLFGERGAGGLQETVRPDNFNTEESRSSAKPNVSFSVNASASQPQSYQVNQHASNTAEQPAAPVRESKSKIIGFLISFDLNKNGEVFQLEAGRWLLTSRPTEHGEYILVDDETISALHAIIRVTKDGKVQILDQLSEHGTGVISSGKKEREVAGSLVNVQHGDIVRFGRRYFVVCLVPKVEIPKAEPELDEESEEKAES